MLGALFTSQAMQEIFTDRAMVDAWLEAEVALARAQASLGEIPQSAANLISKAASTHHFDLDALGRAVTATAHPCISVIRELAVASGDGGRYVHLGATTQDITDTGLVLQVKGAITLTEQRLIDLIGVLSRLAQTYRDLPMVGRTHAQHALPITLGLKFAVLLAEFGRHLERLRQARPRILVGQLGGAVGSMAALGEQAFEVQETMMASLGLAVPVAPWHTARDGFAELTCLLSMIAASCGKVANEVRVLQRTEVHELEEPFAEGKVGSSTMPHKRNPMFAEFIVSNAILAREAPPSMLAAMVQEHERDMTMWGVEWTVIPDAFSLSAGLLERVHTLLDGLVVNPDNITRNLHQLGDLLLSEAVMMELSKHLGKSESHEVIYQAAMRSWKTGEALSDILSRDPQVMVAGITQESLSKLLTPELYIGKSPDVVDATCTWVAQHVLGTVTANAERRTGGSNDL